MIKNDVIDQAIDQCIKELYSYAYPKITWEEFIEQNKLYKEKEEEYNKLKEKSDFCGYLESKPFEFYYLPKEILKDIVDSYVYAYRLDEKQEFLDNIKVLKDYCKNPIIEKYIEGENGNPGHRGYEHPDNLEKVINKYLDLEFPLMDPEMASDADDFDNKLEKASKELQDKFFEFLDMAGNFFDWNRNLNTFLTSIYLGASPSSNKESVIKNWKKYRNQDIEIDEEQIKKDYYGEKF